MFNHILSEKNSNIKYYDICQTKSVSNVISSKDGYATVSSSVVGASIK
jgi:hypothetical protein